MAQYVYKKYNAIFNSSYYYLAQSTPYWDTQPSISGYTGYTFDQNTGIITYLGAQSSTTAGTRYTGSSTSLTARNISNGNVQVTDYSSQYSPSYYSRGTYIGPVIAEDGTYPNNARHTDGFWYERTLLAENPTLISPNGGEVIDQNHTITWTNPRSGLRTQVELTRDNGQTWTTLLSRSSVDATSFTFNFVNTPESSLSKIRITSWDGDLAIGADDSNGVFTIRHNQAPFKPTLLDPVNRTIDFDTPYRFRWQHNDDGAQASAQVQYREYDTVNGYISSWMTKDISGSEQETNIMYDPGVGPGQRVRMEWRVRTVDQFGLISPWSDVGVYYIGSQPNAPVITSPEPIVNDARPIISWTFPSQVAYKLRIRDALGDLAFDSGTVNSTIRTVTSPIDFVNGAEYTIEIEAVDNIGLWSDIATLEVLVSYTPPKVPVTESFVLDGGVRLSWINPAPDEGEPEVVRNEVYKLINDEWLRIAFGEFRSFTDYDVASEEALIYKVRALGENGTFSDSPNIQQTAARITGMYLYDVLDPAGTIHHFKNVDAYTRAEEAETEHDFRHYAGRERPVLVYGEFEDMIVNADLYLISDEIGASKLRSYRKNRSVLQYRDGYGRKFYTSIPQLRLLEVTYGHKTELTFREIDYEGGV